MSFDVRVESFLGKRPCDTATDSSEYPPRKRLRAFARPTSYREEPGTDEDEWSDDEDDPYEFHSSSAEESEDSESAEHVDVDQTPVVAMTGAEKQSERQFNRNIRICCICHVATGRLAQHINRYHPRLSKSEKKATVSRSTTETNRVVSNAIFYESDINRLSANESVVVRVRNMLTTRGMVVKEGERPAEKPVWLNEEDRAVRVPPRVLEPPDELPEGADLLETSEAGKRSVKQQLAEAGLYVTAEAKGSALLEKYRRYQKRTAGSAAVAAQYFSTVQMIASYVLRNTWSSEGSLTVAKFLDDNGSIDRYFDTYERISKNWNTVAKVKKALKQFLDFLLAVGDIGMDDVRLRTKAAQLQLRMKAEISAAEKKAHRRTSEKHVARAREGNPFGMEEVFEFLFNEEIRKRLERIAECTGVVVDTDYVFYVGYLMFYLMATNAQRVQVVDGGSLRMLEWNARVEDEIVGVDGEPYRATSLSLVNNKTAPNILHVVIPEADMHLFTHYVDKMRPQFAEELDKATGEEAPFFVNTKGAAYGNPANAINVWLAANQTVQPGGQLFTCMKIRHLAATRNSEIRFTDPARYQATLTTMGHSGRTQRRYYNEDNIKSAIRGHETLARFGQRPTTLSEVESPAVGPSTRSHNRTSSPLNKHLRFAQDDDSLSCDREAVGLGADSSDEQPTTGNSTEKHRQQTRTSKAACTVADRIERLPKGESPSADRNGEEEQKGDPLFFESHPLILGELPYNLFSEEDVQRFQMTKRQMRDKIRNAQQQLREDAVAFEMSELAEMENQAARLRFINNVVKVRNWRIHPKKVMKRFDEISLTPLTEEAAEVMRQQLADTAKIPANQEAVDEVAAVRMGPLEDRHKFLARKLRNKKDLPLAELKRRVEKLQAQLCISCSTQLVAKLIKGFYRVCLDDANWGYNIFIVCSGAAPPTEECEHPPADAAGEVGTSKGRKSGTICMKVRAFRPN